METQAPRETSDTDRTSGRSLSAKQFWELMERWRVPDSMALDLIGFAGKMGKSGKRPRFRFSPLQRRATSWLSEIAAALAPAGEDPGWLHRESRAAPFKGKTPLALMVAAGVSGMAEVLRFLTRAALRRALRR